MRVSPMKSRRLANRLSNFGENNLDCEEHHSPASAKFPDFMAQNNEEHEIAFPDIIISPH